MSAETLPLFEPTGTADIDKEANHRYSLSRIWEPTKPKVMFIGLNPSRADAKYNDATIIRCMNFAKSWGYGGLWFGNLYSIRTPYVTRAALELATLTIDIVDIVTGRDWQPLIESLEIAHNATTDVALRWMVGKCDRIICAWGAFEFAGPRAVQVMQMIEETHAPYCLGKNKDGSPRHPLYLPKTTQPELYV